MLCVAAWVWFCLSTEFVVVPLVAQEKACSCVLTQGEESYILGLRAGVAAKGVAVSVQGQRRQSADMKGDLCCSSTLNRSPEQHF